MATDTTVTDKFPSLKTAKASDLVPEVRRPTLPPKQEEEEVTDDGVYDYGKTKQNTRNYVSHQDPDYQ